METQQDISTLDSERIAKEKKERKEKKREKKEKKRALAAESEQSVPSPSSSSSIASSASGSSAHIDIGPISVSEKETPEEKAARREARRLKKERKAEKEREKESQRNMDTEQLAREAVAAAASSAPSIGSDIPGQRASLTDLGSVEGVSKKKKSKHHASETRDELPAAIESGSQSVPFPTSLELNLPMPDVTSPGNGDLDAGKRSKKRKRAERADDAEVEDLVEPTETMEGDLQVAANGAMTLESAIADLERQQSDSQMLHSTNDNILPSLSSSSLNVEIDPELQNLSTLATTSNTLSSATTSAPRKRARTQKNSAADEAHYDLDGNLIAMGVDDQGIPEGEEGKRTRHQIMLATTWLSPKALNELVKTEGLIRKLGPFSKPEQRAITDAIESYKRQYGKTDEQVIEIVHYKQKGGKRETDKEFWKHVAMSTPGRALHTVLDHVRRRYNPYGKKGTWKEEEDETLAKSYTKYGPEWNKIAVDVDRAPEDCRDRWRNILEHRGTRSSGPWTKQEEALLYRAVAEVCRAQGVDIAAMFHKDPSGYEEEDRTPKLFWGIVATKMDQKRSRISCRCKWLNDIARRSIPIPADLDTSSQSNNMQVFDPILSLTRDGNSQGMDLTLAGSADDGSIAIQGGLDGDDGMVIDALKAGKVRWGKEEWFELLARLETLPPHQLANPNDIEWNQLRSSWGCAWTGPELKRRFWNLVTKKVGSWEQERLGLREIVEQLRVSIPSLRAIGPNKKATVYDADADPDATDDEQDNTNGGGEEVNYMGGDVGMDMGLTLSMV